VIGLGFCTRPDFSELCVGTAVETTNALTESGSNAPKRRSAAPV
jgi:hypothetical protein